MTAISTVVPVQAERWPLVNSGKGADDEFDDDSDQSTWRSVCRGTNITMVARTTEVIVPAGQTVAAHPHWP